MAKCHKSIKPSCYLCRYEQENNVSHIIVILRNANEMRTRCERDANEMRMRMTADCLGKVSEIY